MLVSIFIFFFFFNDTATTEIYTLSLHDALPISAARSARAVRVPAERLRSDHHRGRRSEEHTSELQSPCNLVCRLLLEKKKKKESTRLSIASRVIYTNHTCRCHLIQHLVS